MRLADLPTPSLILDRGVLTRNCQAMAARMSNHGVRLRPHLKTSKSIDVARLATSGQFGGITVSTLAEARYFAEKGVTDITYGVGLVPGKLDQVAALVAQGVRMTLLTDCPEMIVPLSDGAQARGLTLPLLIEIDSGEGRGGVQPGGETLLEIGRLIDQAPGLSLEGVLTHAGHSYKCRSIQAIELVAEQERVAVTSAAALLRDAGLPCPVVSAGSTPTAICADSLEGVTEMRPGVYVFFDLMMMGLGVCRLDEIALSVLATVIGHQPSSGRVLIDAGALALSKDIGANHFLDKVGYGLVCAPDSTHLMGGLYVATAYQEHGMVAAPDGPPPYENLPVGSRVRVLPNHACMTAAAHGAYQVVDGSDEVIDTWGRVNGW
ncbi:MAG: alanine racemase [Pseudomonadota bacterium]